MAKDEDEVSYGINRRHQSESVTREKYRNYSKEDLARAGALDKNSTIEATLRNSGTNNPHSFAWNLVDGDGSQKRAECE